MQRRDIEFLAGRILASIVQKHIKEQVRREAEI